uniref:serine/threonine-protein kinase PEPKR2-like n=1 Tax=Erigeron canadensis TaxID=72917 RepID=UPI001CB9BFDB|nr:serine/threonine-protein kinase PEPKR2-like [Erigeron canadensis]
MRKKRKGSDLLLGTDNKDNKEKEIVESTGDSESLLSKNIKCHYSLEDYVRLKKRCCKENEVVCGDSSDDDGNGSFKNRRVAATAPVRATSSLVSSGRGIKRKIGCIDVATQMGRKSKIVEDYVKGDSIGKGKFGSVWLCRCRATGVEYACKTLVKGEETVHREVEIMQHLSGHPGVVTLKAVYEDQESFHLVMELCSGGRLIDQMSKEGRYSEQRAANIFKELMMVIKYCHDMGVVHRDVKPENILLTSSGKIKLADFGLAVRITKGQSLAGLAGSPAYVSPEVITGNYTEKADVWSAGILLHALLVGNLPFQGDSLEDVFEAIKTVKLDFHTGVWESVSKPARDLLERILTRNASSRITAEEVLSHPWIIFYTERNLKSLSFKSKSKHQAGPSSQTAATTSVLELTKRLTINGSVIKYSSPVLTSRSLSHDNSEEYDDSGLVDALAVAISNVRISEPKRSRLCVSTSPIREQCSSNVTSNNLCKAC